MTNIISSLNWRYATKIFNSSKKISEPDLNELLEVLRLSPSSFGLQPWKFVVVTDPEIRHQLKQASFGQSQVTDASHFIVFTAPTSLTATFIDHFIATTAKIRQVDISSLSGFKSMLVGFVSSKSSEQIGEWVNHQIYIALGFLLYASAQKQIDATPMEGFNPSEYDRILDFKGQGLRSVVACALGYRSEDDKYSALAKVRYQKEEIVLSK
jgi:nitroreductase